MSQPIHLQTLPASYAISRLAPSEAIPAWADGAGFVSICRTADELSIVCAEQRVPAGVKTDREWTAFRFIGPFAFTATGIVLAVIQITKPDYFDTVKDTAAFVPAALVVATFLTVNVIFMKIMVNIKV